MGELGGEMRLDFVVEAWEYRTWVPREGLMVFSSPTQYVHVMDRLWEVFEGERARGRRATWLGRGFRTRWT